MIPLAKRIYVRYEQQSPSDPIDFQEYQKNAFGISRSSNLIRKEYTWDQLSKEDQKELIERERFGKITENQLKLLNDLINKQANHVALRQTILNKAGVNTLEDIEASMASELIGEIKRRIEEKK